MNDCFIKLPISIYPLIKDAHSFLEDWPEKRMDKLLDISFINPELLEYFKSRNISIRESFILWHWHISQKNRLPHTDGDWFGKENHVKKRLCGINWNFTPKTRVEFYSTEGATPKFWYRSEYDFSTSWENTTKIIDVWDDEGPVLFNPQVPHDIKGDVGVEKRLSMTLRFNETYESLRDKLNG